MTATPSRLQVAPNRRFLQYDDGTPFFYLGDTAWELFHRLTLAEAERYLANRAAKGFTVIQAVALAELDGLSTPNANGDLPLFDEDPSRPNDAYFRHVDAIVTRANALGLVMGLLPTWGSYWRQSGWNAHPIFTPESAYSYGRFLGERYRDGNLIWILGGDRTVSNDTERAVITSMAAGLADGDGGVHLKTYHPIGPGRSAELFPDEPWLDFHMCQTSHGAHDHDNGLLIEADYAHTPTKPTVDGEPRYETIPVGFYFQHYNRYDRFDAYDVRQAAYWALLAGACGHTYGNNNIWQMWDVGRAPVLFADIPWHQALDHPGAFQMGLLRRVFTARNFQALRPAPEFILDGPRHGGAKVRAARAEDGSFAFIYSPRGEAFTVDRRLLPAARLKEIWFDPRYGSEHHIHTTDGGAMQTYTPPTRGRGNDWLLILEGEAA
jgi:hypothetical protein